MTNEEIIELAHDLSVAGIDIDFNGNHRLVDGDGYDMTGEIIAFARAIRDRALEEAAEKCMRMNQVYARGGSPDHASGALQSGICIRAMKGE